MSGLEVSIVGRLSVVDHRARIVVWDQLFGRFFSSPFVDGRFEFADAGLGPRDMRFKSGDDRAVPSAMRVSNVHDSRCVPPSTRQHESMALFIYLYCCWCAQDLVESNRFYELMGFVAIAYRAGSAKKKRVHII